MVIMENNNTLANVGKSKDILKSYKEYLIKEGKVDSTIKSYMGDIKGFLIWLKTKNVDFTGSLTRFYVTSYKKHLEDKNYTINTINKKINSLNSFNEFLINKGLCNEKAVYPRKDKIKIAKGSEGKVEVFSDEEIEKILFYLENKDKVKERDRTIILILLYTGLRVSELVNIKINDMDLLTLNLNVVGKGGKYREVPLKGEVKDAIKEYMEGERRNSRFTNSKHLLLTERSGKMDKDTVNKLLNKHGENLNLRIYPHKFRHTFCTRLIKKGVDLTTVAKLAGHASIQTTAEFYINTSQEEKEEAINLL